jgi:hypothetical protein
MAWRLLNFLWCGRVRLTTTEPPTMRKLALLAIATLPLLGGCFVQPCDVPTASIAWTLQDTSGQAWACSNAGVTTVDLYIGSAGPVSFRCADDQGVVDLSAFAPGVYPATLEGLGADGTIYDRAQFNVTVGDCGGGRYYPVLGEATLNVDYHFGSTAATDVCYGGGQGYIWFALWDEVAGGWLSRITTSSSTAFPSWRDHYACGTSVQFPVPFGTYTLRGIQEVINPLTSTPTAVAETCTATSVVVDHLGVGTVTYLTPPDLRPPSSALACYPGAAP